MRWSTSSEHFEKLIKSANTAEIIAIIKVLQFIEQHQDKISCVSKNDLKKSLRFKALLSARNNKESQHQVREFIIQNWTTISDVIGSALCNYYPEELYKYLDCDGFESECCYTNFKDNPDVARPNNSRFFEFC
jgi:hypothetical protein